MKNNWVRLIAGVLVSVALVGAISLTGGMKKGSRTDGLLYEASGLHPDGQLLMVNGKTVTCEEYLYWLAYDCEYLSTYVQDIDWSAELTSGVTYGDYAQTDTLETVKLYSVVRAWAEEAGITLTDEDQEALDAQRLEYVTYYGGEEAYQRQLAKGTPDSSWTGSASMSARSATHLPGPLPPWSRPTTAVGRGCWISSTPIFSSSERMRAAVRVSRMPVSGWAWISRRMATSSSKILSTKVRISDI